MKSSRAVRALVASGALGLLSLGCDGVHIFGGGDCTLIGCTDALTVQLEALPAGPFTVELLVPGVGDGSGSGVTYSYRCTGTGTVPCRQSIVFSELTPSRAIVRVTTSAGTRTTEIPSVNYTVSYPNGRDCEPRCVQGTVVARLPA